MTTEIQRSDANGLSYARAFNSRQEAEIWALAAFGRTMSGVTFHESQPAGAWIDLRNVRSNDEASNYDPPYKPGSKFVRITAERVENYISRDLRRRLVSNLTWQHETANLGRYGSTQCALAGCSVCQLIAEAKG